MRGQSAGPKRAFEPGYCPLPAVGTQAANLPLQQPIFRQCPVDWKYALSLEMTDPGFDASVLSEFRGRLIAGSAEMLLFETVLNHLRERQLLKPRGRQRTDSTHILAAIQVLNRIDGFGPKSVVQACCPDFDGRGFRDKSSS